MSKSMNMLRTRRRDNNVKPNRKLDRKSSRGMIYENEELRLKTININAEVERGQSDIKKLKRENEMLKKEIWCLRDEYEKLDKLLKEKEINFSSSSTTCTTSETESCSSCSSDSDQVETNQNLENVQKTNLKNLHVEFDHLSVVPEENSTENSDKNSNRTSIPNDSWTNEKNIIKPDQSYPSFETLSKANTLQMQEKMPKHFFSPIKSSKSCDGSLNNEFIPQATPNLYESHSQYYLSRLGEYPRQTYPQQGGCAARVHPVYENLKPHTLGTMQPISKSSTDLIVKMDNQNFNTMTSSSFSNGGNLEELLNDIESISQDILKLSNPNLSYNGDNHPYPHGYEQDMSPNQPNYENIPENREVLTQTVKPYKSELNVVLMPTPMPLIGFEKYRNISAESLKSKSLDNLTDTQNMHQIEQQNDIFYPNEPIQNAKTALNYLPPTPIINPNSENPFYFGPANTDYFNRYNPDNYINNGLDKSKKQEMCSSKTNLIEGTSNEQISSENEENLKFKTTKVEKEDSKSKEKPKVEKKPDKPKLNITRKVSIHFKGKKDKKREDTVTPKTPSEKKHPIFDIKFSSETKKDGALQKTPSIDSKKSNVEEPKTGSSSDSKTDKRNSTSNEPRTPCADCKIPEKTERKCSFDGRLDARDKKTRKSQSVSPERKHVHVKDEAKKQHKKHKKADKLRNRRSTISNERHAERVMRERSFSVCTDRSNMLGMGYNSGYSVYDDYMSDRERTNSLSSSGTVKMRKMSNISSFPVTGKIPWCGCWGNGCL